MKAVSLKCGAVRERFSGISLRAFVILFGDGFALGLANGRHAPTDKGGVLAL